MSDKTKSRQTARSFWKKLLLGSLICLGLLGFIVWFGLLRSVPIEISKETTYLTGPLTSDGKAVDYFRAIELETYPPNMKTDENGFRMIIREIGVSSESVSPAWIAPQIYKKLGLDPSIPPRMKYQDPYEFIEEYTDRLVEESKQKELEKSAIIENFPEVAEFFDNFPKVLEENPYEKGEKLEKGLNQPWTFEEMPIMVDWFKNNGPALDLVTKAVHKPVFFFPIIRESEKDLLAYTLLPEVQRLRSFARGLQVRANYRIAQGDLDGAIDDILACKTLGRRTTHNIFMVTCFVGLAIEGIADGIGIADSLDHQPTEAQLKRLLDVLVDTTGKKMPARITNLQKVLDCERYVTLDIAQALADPSRREKVLNAPDHKYHDATVYHTLGYLGFDWNLVLEKINEYFDYSEKLSGHIEKQLHPIKLISPSSRAEQLAIAIICEFMREVHSGIRDWRSQVDDYYGAIHRNECANRLQVITLAMLLYEKQHGTLPPAWTVDKEGKPLHSWRVLLLPYLGEEAKKLYAKIRLDEPWDSPHNRRFHQAAVPVYQYSNPRFKPGETPFTVILGKKTAFRGSKGVKLDTFGPHSANLVLVAERKDPICWMDPTSEVSEADAKTKIGNEDTAKSHLGFRSGAAIALWTNFLDGTYTPAEDEEPDPNLFQKLLEGTAESVPYSYW